MHSKVAKNISKAEMHSKHKILSAIAIVKKNVENQKLTNNRTPFSVIM
jgi:hypothetical protein